MSVQSPTAKPGGRKRRRGVVSAYDFQRPTTLAREHSRALEVAFETFARQWSTLLLTRLRQPCTAALVSVEAKSYEDHLATVPATGVLVVFRPDPDGERGLLALSTETAMSAVDFLLGGRGTQPTAPAAGATGATGGAGSADGEPERELTDIERRLLEDLAGRTLADLAYAFLTVAPMAPELAGIEQSAQFLQLAAAADVVVVAELTLALGEDGEPRPVSLMLPMAPVVARLAAHGGEGERSEERRRARARAADVLSRAVPELPVDVSARLAGTAMRPREVAALSVGDVVRLPHPTTRPLDVVTHDVVLARAVAGTSGTRLACLVVSPDEETR